MFWILSSPGPRREDNQLPKNYTRRSPSSKRLQITLLRTSIPGTEDTTGGNFPGKGHQLPRNYPRRSLPSKRLPTALLMTCSPRTEDTTGESFTGRDNLSEILQRVLLTRTGSGQRQEEQPEAEEEVLLAGL